MSHVQLSWGTSLLLRIWLRVNDTSELGSRQQELTPDYEQHLTEVHEPAFNDVWQRVELLPKGYPQDLFKFLMIASRCVVEWIVGVQRDGTKQFVSAVDCRTINAAGSRQFYFILLGSFVFQLMVLNPKLQCDFLISLALVCGRWRNKDNFLESCKGCEHFCQRL